MGTAKIYKKGKYRYFIFRTPWGYVVDRFTDKNSIPVTVAPKNGKFYSSRSTAKKTLDKILKGGKSK
jgi:hypothetical protein